MQICLYVLFMFNSYTYTICGFFLASSCVAWCCCVAVSVVDMMVDGMINQEHQMKGYLDPDPKKVRLQSISLNRARKSRTTLQNKVRLKVLPEQLTLFVNTSVTFKKCIIQ